LIAVIPMVLIIFIIGPQLFGWYLGEDWLKAGVFARVMIIPIAIGLITSPISSTPLIYKKQTISFIINFIGMLVAASTFYAVSITTQSVYYALISLALVQSFLYLILLAWYFKLSKV